MSTSSHHTYPLGCLEINAPNGIIQPITYKFTQTETGKMHELHVMPQEIEHLSPLFSLDPTLILNTLTQKPTIHFSSGPITLEYQYEIAKTQHLVTITIPEKSYDLNTPYCIIEMQQINRIKQLELEKRINDISRQISIPNPPPEHNDDECDARYDKIISQNDQTFLILRNKINALESGLCGDVETQHKLIVQLTEQNKNLQDVIKSLQEKMDEMENNISSMSEKMEMMVEKKK